jgi:hypothetical protein
LYATTSSTFTLTQNLTSTSTCFTIFGNNITIDGNIQSPQQPQQVHSQSTHQVIQTLDLLQLQLILSQI